MTGNLKTAFYYETIDSTQDEAKRLIESGQIKDLGVVIADEQTKGKGTKGRAWSSPKGGIYLSIVHIAKKDKLFPISNLYTSLCATACQEAIKEVLNINSKIKPINDIYFNEKKLGGVLVESKLHEKGISSLISGVGINLHKTNHKLDRDIVEPISLEEIIRKEDFKQFSKEKLIETIVAKICKKYSDSFC